MMTMGIEGTALIFFGLIFIWLAALTFFLYKTFNHYHKITKGVDGKTLTSVLEKLISDFTKTEKDVLQISSRLQKQEQSAEFKIQKAGLLRFNPFADTGGEQSFIVCLLDNKNNGLVLTSLQGRSGTRWYAKMVKKGKGVEYSLSKEEEEAIKQTKPLS